LGWWANRSRAEKLLVATAVALIAWQGLGMAYEAVAAVAQGTNPLSESPSCFFTAPTHPALGSSTTCAAPVPGQSNTDAGPSPSSSASSFSCILSFSNFAQCVGQIVAGLPIIAQILSAINYLENAFAGVLQAFDALNAGFQTVLNDIASFWSQLPGFIWSTLANGANTLWNIVVGPAEAWLGGIVNAVQQGFQSTLSSIVSVFEAGVQELVNLLLVPFDALFAFANSVATSTGPFAPVIVMLIVGGVIAAAILLVFLFVNLMWGVGKTLFNIL
jgi:hypothetical protein